MKKLRSERAMAPGFHIFHSSHGTGTGGIDLSGIAGHHIPVAAQWEPPVRNEVGEVDDASIAVHPGCVGDAEPYLQGQFKAWAPGSAESWLGLYGAVSIASCPSVTSVYLRSVRVSDFPDLSGGSCSRLQGTPCQQYH